MYQGRDKQKRLGKKMFTGVHRNQAPFGTAVLETVAAAKAEPATQPPLARSKVRGGRREQESLRQTIQIQYLGFIFGPKPGDPSATSTLEALSYLKLQLLPSLSVSTFLGGFPCSAGGCVTRSRKRTRAMTLGHHCSGFGRQTRQEQDPAWGFRVEYSRLQTWSSTSFS